MRRWMLVVSSGFIVACSERGSDVNSTGAGDRGAEVESLAGGTAGAGGISGGGASGSAGVAGSGGNAAGGSGGTSDSGTSGSGGAAGCGSGTELSGTWREESQLTCDGGEREPHRILYELFFDGGQVFVTWRPFETYVDYWGTYVVASQASGTGALSIRVDGGNFVPDDIDPEGTYSICGDTLILQDMWLGSYWDVPDEAGCGHRFRR